MNRDQQQMVRITRSNSLNDSTLNENLKSLLNDLKIEIFNKLDDVNSNILSLASRIESLEVSLSSIKATQNNQQHEIQTIKQAISSTTNNINSLQERVLDEVEQRQRRVNSIVVFGLTEQTSGSAEQRQKMDEQDFHAITEVLNMKNVECTSCTRVGKIESGKTRPLRINVKTLKDKAQLISRSKQLKNSRFNRVFLKPDLTPSQQLMDKRLREELRERRSKNEDVVIYRGKVIKRADEYKNFLQ